MSGIVVSRPAPAAESPVERRTAPRTGESALIEGRRFSETSRRPAPSRKRRPRVSVVVECSGMPVRLSSDAASQSRSAWFWGAFDRTPPTGSALLEDPNAFSEKKQRCPRASWSGRCREGSW